VGVCVFVVVSLLIVSLLVVSVVVEALLVVSVIITSVLVISVIEFLLVEAVLVVSVGVVAVVDVSIGVGAVGVEEEEDGREGGAKLRVSWEVERGGESIVDAYFSEDDIRVDLLVVLGGVVEREGEEESTDDSSS